MKTIIEYRDGRQEEHVGTAPSIEEESQMMVLVDADSTVVSEPFALESVKRVVFEP